MHRSKILVRTLFIFILLAGLVAGIFLSSQSTVNAAKSNDAPACQPSMAQWDFNESISSTNTVTNPTPSLSNVTVSASENGVGGVGFTATGAHSGKAWSGSGWSTTSTPNTTYFEFDISTVGYANLVMSFYASSSSKGPTTTSVQYSITGTTPYTEIGQYPVPQSSTPSQISIDFSSIIALNNNANAKFRIYGINAGSGAGTLRIDDVTFNGCQPADLTSTSLAANLTGTAAGLTETAAAATASADNLTATESSNLTATASSDNLTGTAVGLTATASSVNLTATSIALTGTPIPTITPTPTITPSATSAPVYSPLSLVINEVGWMGTQCSTNDEWVELYNPGSSPINLSGWDLIGTNYYYTSGNFTIALQDQNNPSNNTIPAGGYFVLAENSTVFKNVTINQHDSTLSLPNYDQDLELYSPTSTLIDWANILGNYNWPAGSASPNYASMERYYPPGGPIPYDGPTAWVTFAGPSSVSSISSDNCGNAVHGTPGRANWASTVTETPSPYPTKTPKPTFTPAPTPVPAIVLNEILPRPGSDWNSDGEVNNYDEFIEVENLGPGIATLTNWKLTVTPNNGISSFIVPTLKLNPNGRAVFFGSTTQLSLEDSGDTVSLVDNYGVVEDAFTYPAVLQPDDLWCRIRDGIGDWRDGCFPTPGFENALSGTLPVPPPPQPGQEAACLLPDVAPDAFRLAECNGSGADIWNQQYWNNLSGQNEYTVPDPNSKAETDIQ